MRLVVCDDNLILGEALASVFEAHGHPVLAIVTRGGEAVEAVSAHQPDACLLDIHLPDGSGLDVARALRERHPETKILILSCLNDPAVVSEAKRAGVAGFLRKDRKPDSIVRAIETVGAGGAVFDQATPRWQVRVTEGRPGNCLPEFTPREAEVLRRIVTGQSTGQMAGEMGIAVSTLRGYVKSILAKLGAHSRLEAAAIASGGQYPSVA